MTDPARQDFFGAIFVLAPMVGKLCVCDAYNIHLQYNIIYYFAKVQPQRLAY